MNNSNLSSQQYFRILDSLPEHVFIFSEQGEYLSVFGGQENKVGSDCKEYIGRTLFDVMPADMASQFHQFITKTLDTNQSQTVKYHFNSQHLQDLPFGSEQHQDLWIEGIIKPFVMDDGKRVVIWTARNVTDKHYMEIKLKELSETDALTGILNRRAFMAQLSLSLKSYQRYRTDTAFLMLDIDHFKAVNDKLGHQDGDIIIQHVTKLCQLELREVDIFGRIGGEEFGIILSNTDIHRAQDVANRLRLSIENTPCEVDDHVINATISIGVSQLEISDEQCKYVLIRSDKAMYQAKRRGRNRVVVYNE